VSGLSGAGTEEHADLAHELVVSHVDSEG
jgi:hypothetical protein